MFNRKYIDSIRGHHFPATAMLDFPGVYIQQITKVLITASNIQPQINTLPETNISPEKCGLRDYFPFGKAYFRGLCYS